LKEEALDRILSRTRSERGSNYRKTDKRDDDDDDDDDDGGDDMILL
jgi:Zn-finger nucleic acid-binding protein